MVSDAIDYIEEDILPLYVWNLCNCKIVVLHMWEDRKGKFVVRANESQNMIKSFLKSGKETSITYIHPTGSTVGGIKKRNLIITKDTLPKVKLIRVEIDQSLKY